MIAWSLAFSNSTFCTGFLSAFTQPRRFQPAIHLVTELITYCESHSTLSGSSGAPAVAVSSCSNAISSPRLLVPWGHPPHAQLSLSMNHAQPAGPGLFREEPSAAATITPSPYRRATPGSGVRELPRWGWAALRTRWTARSP